MTFVGYGNAENYITDIERLKEAKELCRDNFTKVCEGADKWLEQQGYNISLREIEAIIHKVFGNRPLVMWGRQLITARAESLVFNALGRRIGEHIFAGRAEVGCVLLAEDLMCVNNADKVTLCSMPLLIGDTAHKHKISPIRANASFLSHRYLLSGQQQLFFRKHFGVEEIDNEGDIVSLHNSLSASYNLKNLGDMADVHREIIKILFKRDSLPSKLWILDGDVPCQISSVFLCSKNLGRCRLLAGDAYKLVFYMLSILPDTIYMVRDGLPKYDDKFTGQAFDELLALTGLPVFPFCDLGPFGDDKQVLVYPGKEAVQGLAVPAEWDGDIPLAAKALLEDIYEKSHKAFLENKRQKELSKQKNVRNTGSIRSPA